MEQMNIEKSNMLYNEIDRNPLFVGTAAVEDRSYSAENCSFTMEFDVKVTDNQTFEGGHPSTLYNWFGGPTQVDFQCGYFFDDSKFMVVESTDLKDPSAAALESVSANFSLNEWHHWVFQYDDDTCVMRFYFDPKMENGHVAADAQPMFNFRYRYFDYGGMEECLMVFRRMNCQIMRCTIFLNVIDGNGLDDMFEGG